MSRWSNHEWLRDLDDEELWCVRRRVETDGFWSYVDSQRNAYTHSGDCEERWHPAFGRRTDCWDWSHTRGDGCLASASDLTKCGQTPVAGLPFCSFHFDRVWEAVSSFVATDRISRIVRQVEFDLKQRVKATEAAIALDVATVRDARRTMAEQPERVYFFAAGGFVKIGRSRHPERRVKNFGNTLAPAGLNVHAGQLLGTIPGGPHVEGELHRRFVRFRDVGEWFRLEPDVGDAIALLLKEHADQESAA